MGQVEARLNKNATTNQGSGNTGYGVFAELDDDGQVNALDLGLVKARLNAKGPQDEPLALAAPFCQTPVAAP